MATDCLQETGLGLFARWSLSSLTASHDCSHSTKQLSEPQTFAISFFPFMTPCGRAE